MRKHFRDWIRSAAWIAAICIGVAGKADVIAAQKLRTIPHNTVRLVDKLEAGDEIVQVNKWAIADGVEMSSQTAEEALRSLSEITDAVAIVHVSGFQSELTKDETWIESRVRGRVEQVFKRANFSNPADKTFEAILDGGELRLTGVLVRAGACTQVETSQRYLMFFQHNPEEDRWYVASAYKITRTNTLEELACRNHRGRPDHVNGLRLSLATAALQRRR
ncbi:MAG: hypothetical protein ACRD2N_25570 [Vicinamibacterales bacterium]